MRIDDPCYGCPERHQNCHSDCKRDANRRAYLAVRKEQERKRRAAEADVTSFIVNQTYSRRRKVDRPGVK